jgi:hypothetical protein
MEINVPDLAGSSAAADGMTIWSGCSSVRAFPPAVFAGPGADPGGDGGARNVSGLAWHDSCRRHVAVFDAKDMPHAMRVAAGLRQAGLRVLVYPDADKIGKQIKYADSRGIPLVALLGSDEIANGTLTVKHLAAKTQQTYEQGVPARRFSRN